MNTLKKETKARLIRNTGRIGVLLLTSITFVFALLSGANTEEGFAGIIHNSPNTLPWLVMFGLIAIAWKTELIGGILLALYNVALLLFFTAGSHFFLAPFILLTLMILFSSCLIVSWFVKWKS